MVNTGNTRRESTQAFLIPKLAGPASTSSPTTARRCRACSRTVSRPSTTTWRCTSAPRRPDPTYLTASSPATRSRPRRTSFIGQNNTGWCNEEASALLDEADATLDEDGPRRPRQGGHRAHGGGLRDAPAAPVPERRRLPHRQGRARHAGATSPTTWRSTTGRTGKTSTVMARSSSVPSSRPRLPQPDHGVRQLVVVRVDRRVPGPARACATPPTTRRSSFTELAGQRAGRRGSLTMTAEVARFDLVSA